MLAEQHKYGWFNRHQICEFLSCTPHWFDQNLKPKIPEQAVDKGELTHLFHGRTVIEVYASNRVYVSNKAKGQIASVTGAVDDFADSDLFGPFTNSPMMERCRLEKWRLLKMQRKEKQGSLISRKKVREALSRCSALLREAGERLKRSFGQRSIEILNEALDTFKTEAQELEK